MLSEGHLKDRVFAIIKSLPPSVASVPKVKVPVKTKKILPQTTRDVFVSKLLTVSWSVGWNREHADRTSCHYGESTITDVLVLRDKGPCLWNG